MIELKPDYFVALLERGLAYRNKGDRTKAIADLREVAGSAATKEQRESAVTALRQLGVRAA